MESTRYQRGNLTLVKNKHTAATWFYRYREMDGARRVQRNVRIGSQTDLPRRRDAEEAVVQLRRNINLGVRTPLTVSDLVKHYQEKEVIPDRKAFATIQGVNVYLKRWILPQWGTYNLTSVKTVAVEEWLGSLDLAPGSKSKIRNIMSAVFRHGMRWDWLSRNPIAEVRTSAARLRDPDLLRPEECSSLLTKLKPREKAMVLLVGSTGLRRSEMFALTWADINFAESKVKVTRSVVQQRFGNVKTPASRKPVPLQPEAADALIHWRSQSMYRDDEDFVFPSIRLNGEKPLRPDMVLKKILRPAIKDAGIYGKVIGWHTFRHSYATYLVMLGEDIKVTQELLRHSSSRTTLDIYAQAVSAAKRSASARVMNYMFPPTVLQ